jgi:hypothetical protein
MASREMKAFKRQKGIRGDLLWHYETSIVTVRAENEPTINT